MCNNNTCDTVNLVYSDLSDLMALYVEKRMFVIANSGYFVGRNADALIDRNITEISSILA